MLGQPATEQMRLGIGVLLFEGVLEVCWCDECGVLGEEVDAACFECAVA
jgi:hypothetical protein